MRKFLIFAIVACFAPDKGFSYEDDPTMNLLERKGQLKLIECEEEYRNKNENASTEGKWCLQGCAIRKMLRKELIASNPKETLKNALEKGIKLVFEYGYKSEEPKITREMMDNQIQECYTNEEDECDFLKCATAGDFFANLDEFVLRDVSREIYDVDS